MEKDVVVVESKDKEGFLCEVYAKGHLLTADEPYNDGGKDYGPNPYDYLSVALGSCTAMTLRNYARIKEYDIESIKVTVSHKKEYREDCKECEKNKGMLDILNLSIKIEGDVDEKIKKRMYQISKKCPVHRTLVSKIEIQTEIEIEGD